MSDTTLHRAIVAKIAAEVAADNMETPYSSSLDGHAASASTGRTTTPPVEHVPGHLTANSLDLDNDFGSGLTERAVAAAAAARLPSSPQSTAETHGDAISQSQTSRWHTDMEPPAHADLTLAEHADEAHVVEEQDVSGSEFVGRRVDDPLHDETLREGDQELDVAAAEHANGRSTPDFIRSDGEDDAYGKPREFAVTRTKSSGGSSRNQPYRKPHSSYYVGPPGSSSAFGSAPMGVIGVHDPREIVRVERDYTSGELIQFSPTFPLELEGRISATQFIETVNSINEILISAHSLAWSSIDNAIAIVTLYISTFILNSHYDKEMRRLAELLDALNAELYNPHGLNILWPRSSAFLFLEIEYY